METWFPIRRLAWLTLMALACSGAHRAEAGWSTGLDLTLEGSARLAGGSGQATMLGQALGHAGWSGGDGNTEGTGWAAHVSVLALAGHGPTGRFLGDFLAASNLEAPAGIRMYSWWLEAQSRHWSLRAGALLADEEFAGTEGGAHFCNSAFGWPAFISANTVNAGPAYSFPGLGVRLEHRRGEAARWRIGVYDGDTLDSAEGDPGVNRHGLRYRIESGQGHFVIAETVLAPGGGPLRFTAGAWLHTAEFDDVRDDAAGRPFALTGATPRRHPANFGGYLAVERTWEDAGVGGRTTSAHLRGGAAPSDRNPLAWTVDAGVNRTGLLPGRPDDITYIGLIHAAFGSRHRVAVGLADPLGGAPDFEQVIEMGHVLVLSGNWRLQPDLQYIRHPGGHGGQRPSLAFLLRLHAGF